MGAWEMFEKMIEELGAEMLAEEMAYAMGENELCDNLEFIARMHDIKLDEDEDEDE